MKKLVGVALILGVGCQAAQEDAKPPPAVVQPAPPPELTSTTTLPAPVTTTTTEPIPEPIVAEEPEPVVATTVYTRRYTTTTAAAITYSRSSSSDLASIRECESGGDYTTDTGNGYYGAYQFDRQTWAAAGGTGNPAHASPAEQDARAQAWINAGHRSAWPNC